MSEELAEIIREEILFAGPITFQKWMELCLYHPQYGYYMKPGRKTGYGRDADFATSPTLHPFFAHAVAREIAACWDRLGKPGTFDVVELGGGEGDLAREALRALDAQAPDLAPLVRWRHVERSGFHVRMQAIGGDKRIVSTVDDEPLETRESRFGFVVANEFLDALPHRWLEWTGTEWQEVHVRIEDSEFREVVLPITHFRPDPEDLPAIEPSLGQRVAIPGFLEGASFHVFAQDWIRFGSILISDYGDRSERLWTEDRMDGTVRGFREHRLVDSVLEAPGDIDITASEDFSLTRQVSKGFYGYGEWIEGVFETQEQFLLRHGILDELNAIDRSTLEGASSYLRLRQLLLPSGMGAAFKVQRFDRLPTPAVA